MSSFRTVSPPTPESKTPMIMIEYRHYIRVPRLPCPQPSRVHSSGVVATVPESRKIHLTFTA